MIWAAASHRWRDVLRELYLFAVRTRMTLFLRYAVAGLLLHLTPSDYLNYLLSAILLHSLLPFYCWVLPCSSDAQEDGCALGSFIKCRSGDGCAGRVREGRRRRAY